MDPGIAWFLLIPFNALAIFSILLGLVNIVYEFGDAIPRMPERHIADPPGLRGFVKRWRTRQSAWWHNGKKRSAIGSALGYIAMLFLTGLIGALVGLFLLYNTSYVQVVGRDTVIRLPDELFFGTLALGFVFGVAILARMWAYVSDPAAARWQGNLSDVSLDPAIIAWPERANLSRLLYLHKSLHDARLLSLAIVVIGGVIGLLLRGSFQEGEALLVLGLYAAAWVHLFALRWLTNLLQPIPRAVLAVQTALDAKASPMSKRSFRLGLATPDADRRRKIETARQAVRRAADKVDGRSPHHPVATLLHGAVRHLTGHLENSRSLQRVIPVEIRNALEDVKVVIAGPATPSHYNLIAQATSAFDAAGRPHADARTPHVGRWSLLTGRSLAILEVYARLLVAVWTVFIIVVAGFLIATGRLDLTSLQLER